MTFFLLITYVKNTILITSAFICLHSCPPSGTSLSFHLQGQDIILSYHQMKLILSSTCMENNCFGQFDSVRCFPSIVLKKKRFSESLRPTHIYFEKVARFRRVGGNADAWLSSAADFSIVSHFLLIFWLWLFKRFNFDFLSDFQADFHKLSKLPFSEAIGKRRR